MSESLVQGLFIFGMIMLFGSFFLIEYHTALVPFWKRGSHALTSEELKEESIIATNFKIPDVQAVFRDTELYVLADNEFYMLEMGKWVRAKNIPPFIPEEVRIYREHLGAKRKP